jgi:dTDP-4-dehydrorhamnose reductase
MEIRTAGIIGTKWGRVHVGALRAAGVEVCALCGRDPEKTRAIADAEGVPETTTRPEDLRACDLVVIASPPATHAAMLALFPGKPRILEKPVLGVHPPSVPLPPASEPVFVNFAFPFLDAAQVATRDVKNLGRVRAARVGARLALDGDHDLRGWFLEVASHPLSYALHLLGPLEPRRWAEKDRRLELELRAPGAAEVHAFVEIGGNPGIRYDVELETEGGRVHLVGELRLGQGPWRFHLAEGTRPAPPTGALDPWVAANHASVARVLHHLRTDEPRPDGLAAGLFDLGRGLLVERALGFPLT